MEEIRRIFRRLIILREACVDEELVKVTVELIEKLFLMISEVLTDSNGLHVLEFTEIFEEDLMEIKRKLKEMRNKFKYGNVRRFSTFIIQFGQQYRQFKFYVTLHASNEFSYDNNVRN